jgi:hypothetical protein
MLLDRMEKVMAGIWMISALAAETMIAQKVSGKAAKTMERRRLRRHCMSPGGIS